MASFDLYDTLVIRSAGPEHAVHHLVAAEAQRDASVDLAVSPDRYVRARREADRAACRRTAAPSLDDIHDLVAEVLDLDERSSRRLRELEAGVELDTLTPVPGSVERLASLRARRIRVAIVSDSHIGSHRLAPRLRALGLLDDDDLLLVSSDHGISKSHGGELFGELTSRAQRAPRAIHHHGDHPRNDRRMARRRGIAASLDRSASFDRYEQVMVDAEDPTGLAGLLAGASRTVRLRAAHRGEPPGLTAVACGLAAPTMIGFGLWLSARLEEERLSHAWFLSRDGRVPMEVFRRLAPAVGCEIESSYLHISRDAVRLASAAAVGLERWVNTGHATDHAFLTEFGEQLPVDRLVEKLGLDARIDGPVFTEHGLRNDAPLEEPGLHAWRGALCDDRILRRLETRSTAALDRLGTYLRQEGVLDHDRLAMVDIGWSGQQAAMITATLAAVSAPAPEIRHLHLGATQRAPLLTSACIDSYLFTPDDAPVPNPVGLYELLSATNEPTMAGLRTGADGRIEPSFRPLWAAQRNPVAAPLHRLIVETVQELAGRLRPDHVDADLRPMLRELAARFWFEPAHDEAVLWGALPWEMDSSGFIVSPFAEPVSLRELPKILRPGGLAGRQWSSGAVAGSALPLRWLLTPLISRHSRRTTR